MSGPLLLNAAIATDAILLQNASEEQLFHELLRRRHTVYESTTCDRCTKKKRCYGMGSNGVDVIGYCMPCFVRHTNMGSSYFKWYDSNEEEESSDDCCSLEAPPDAKKRKTG